MSGFTVLPALRRLFTPLLDVVYPPRCLHCGAVVDAADPLCTPCLADAMTHPFTDAQSRAHLATLRAPAHAQAMYVGFEYERDGAIEACLHAMKYRGMHRIGRWLGRVLGERMVDAGVADAGTDPLLVPVPLHRVRRLERGFNQSEAICEGVAMETGWDVSTRLLRRVRYTESQAASKFDIEHRRSNVAGVFEVDSMEGERVAGRSIWLVDDLITTGATIGACSLLLSERGLRDLTLLAVARPAREKEWVDDARGGFRGPSTASTAPGPFPTAP